MSLEYYNVVLYMIAIELWKNPYSCRQIRTNSFTIQINIKWKNNDALLYV